MKTRECRKCGQSFRAIGNASYCPEHSPRSGGVYTKKLCAECGVEFQPMTGSAKYCPEHSKGSWERNNPEEANANARRNTRRWRHREQWGDPDIYLALVERDGEKCRICGAAPEPGFHLAIDHDHGTNLIRGLLCQNPDGKGGCNPGLGYFGDDAARLHAAGDYLESAVGCRPEDLIYTGPPVHERVGKGTKLINGKRVLSDVIDSPA